MADTLLWYDLETFGRIPGWDRVAQFASVRTNLSFEPIEDPVVLYCRPSPDYLPDPNACLITGITPFECLEKGLREADFIAEIGKIFSAPKTTVIGYNNIRFDDEFIRNLYYRNFRDPYEREYKRGNSRWDLLDVVRMTHDLRPHGIKWPVYEETGMNSFRLSDLTEANGIGHEHAHDALSDVYATIGMAKLIHDKQPKIFNYLFTHRTKDVIRKSRIIDLDKKEAFVHTSRMFSIDGSHSTTLVIPLAIDTVNRNKVLCFDLREDPAPLMDLSVGEIRERVFTPKDEMPEGKERIHLKGVHVNKCPAIAPLTVLDDDSIHRLGLDVPQCLAHARELQKIPELTLKIRKIFEPEPPEKWADPDLQIYSGGFFGEDDKREFDNIRRTPPEELVRYPLNTFDHRVPEMFRRYIARNYPDQLDDIREKQWRRHCANYLLYPPYETAYDMRKYDKELAELAKKTDLGAQDLEVLNALKEYGDQIKRDWLDYE